MVNEVFLIGRITKDLELKYTNNGNCYLKFNLAVNRNFKKENEEEKTDFIPVTVWGKLAENMDKYTGKGSLIAVIGRIEISQYKDKEGNTKYSTDVIARDVRFLNKIKKQEEALGDMFHEIDCDELPDFDDNDKTVPF